MRKVVAAYSSPDLAVRIGTMPIEVGFDLNEELMIGHAKSAFRSLGQLSEDEIQSATYRVEEGD